MTTVASHMGFLEELAREECRLLNCKEHSLSGDVVTAADDEDAGNNMDVDEEEQLGEERRRVFLLVDFSSHDDDDDIMSESDYFSSDDEEGDMSDSDEDLDDEEGDAVNDDVIDVDALSDDGSLNDDANEQPLEDDDHRSNNEAVNTETSKTQQQEYILSPLIPNDIYQRIGSLLFNLSNSEEVPLIRADIPWSIISSCDAPLLTTLYKRSLDPGGTMLLQGTLRMDPPLDAVKKIIDAFPLSCVDMEGFFTACQFAQPRTSRMMRPVAHDFNNNGKMNAADDSYDDDVGEVVRLIMHKTILARRSNNIGWSMVAFLGHPHVNISHAKLLLHNNPDALIDPAHGAFGVSPLDRMASGYFIHGDPIEWAEKLRLALKVAAYIRANKKEGAETVLPEGFFRPVSSFSSDSRASSHSSESFFPYHELIRLITSEEFRGHKFGVSGWMNTLEACTSSDSTAFLRPDNLGNLPLHAALGSECKTTLGLKSERRLIKYLLSLDKNMALCREGGIENRLPLRMSIENGWPVYDLIIDSALSRTSLRRNSKDITENLCNSTPLLHDALMGPYHERFGIHGARQLIKKIMDKMNQVLRQLQQQERIDAAKFNLVQFVDSNGRTALHVALQNKWPVYDLLIKEFPTGLENQDPSSSLFPFQTLAVALKDDSPFETSMLYDLIRGNPLCIDRHEN
ncbi:hypothetical protein ACHAWT_007652 [Skeletonema menzelii]